MQVEATRRDAGLESIEQVREVSSLKNTRTTHHMHAHMYSRTHTLVHYHSQKMNVHMYAHAQSIRTQACALAPTRWNVELIDSQLDLTAIDKARRKFGLVPLADASPNFGDIVSMTNAETTRVFSQVRHTRTQCTHTNARTLMHTHMHTPRGQNGLRVHDKCCALS